MAPNSDPSMTLSPIRQVKGSLTGLEIAGYRETPFFATHQGQLCQWVEVSVTYERWRSAATFTVATDDNQASTDFLITNTHGRTLTLRIHAPVVWPRPTDHEAVLTVVAGDETLTAQLTVGTHRPWSIYLLSDLCADDTWAYADLEQHDRDDYLATLGELNAGSSNAYNLPTAYQVTRFRRQASNEELDALGDAIAQKRFHVSAIPNQLECSLYPLALYPTLLSTYRRELATLGLDPTEAARVVYHMEAPTWSNGLVSMMASTGTRIFVKSLLQYQAPWVSRLRTLPRLLRLACGPGAWIYLLMRAGDYTEGFPVMAGVLEANRYLVDEVIPEHLDYGDAFPTTALPLVGTYSDLCPDIGMWSEAKLRIIAGYNRQGWEYPKLVNASWEMFADHLLRDIGDPQAPTAPGLVEARGDTGGSWEAWPASAQAEHAGLRRAQRDLVSLRALVAMWSERSPEDDDALEHIEMHTVQLGDHAWNGSSEASKALNLRIRRDRLSAITAACSQIRERADGSAPLADGPVTVANTLGWDRPVRVALGELPATSTYVLADEGTGESFAVGKGRDGAQALIDTVPGFGARHLVLATQPPAAAPEPARPPHDHLLLFHAGSPRLEMDGEVPWLEGGWTDLTHAEWVAGPFTIRAELRYLKPFAATEISLHITGAVPDGPCELQYAVSLPTPEVRWRVEGGGEFFTPGDTADGGDSLLGIVGSVIAAGTAVQATDAATGFSWTFASRDTGLCELGGPMAHLTSVAPAEARWASTSTSGEIRWILHSSARNHREIFHGQGGTTEWHHAFAVRTSNAPLSDADLYRFGAGVMTPGELLRGETQLHSVPMLAGSADVIPLVLQRDGDAAVLTVYSASDTAQTVTLGSPEQPISDLTLTDVLGRRVPGIEREGITLPPRQFRQFRWTQ